ncbi:MAG: LLM class flavin-dependent oxidoreductase [Sinobacteraceae bacterium]|nr:LLM class flavin-dependent oxidoreductase [Nevskiaceae bacterium]
MIPLSILDLAPICENGSAGASFVSSVELARHADDWGFTRYWLAEHHGMPGIASAATAVLIGHVAAATRRIRVGAGGIMLPNHAPLVVAEQFGTLNALYPGRIDLGLGRAPGSDQQTARALRRSPMDAENFPQDVVELRAYFTGEAGVLAVPGKGEQVPVWILGSSRFSAHLAAALSLPYVFASHFAPGELLDALTIYRHEFKPSQALEKPYVMLGYNVFAADTDEQARYLATSWQQAFVSLRSGRPSRLPPPVEGYYESLPQRARAVLDSALSCSAIGSPQTVAAQMQGFVEKTQADELILTCNMYDPAARMASFEIASKFIDS